MAIRFKVVLMRGSLKVELIVVDGTVALSRLVLWIGCAWPKDLLLMSLLIAYSVGMMLNLIVHLSISILI